MGMRYHIIANSRILRVLKGKMDRMAELVKKCCGSRQFLKTLEKWKNGRDSTWKFRIYYSEVDNAKLVEMEGNQNLKSKNSELKHEKKKAEEDLNLKQQNIAKLEKNLKEALSLMHH